jgi:hypothetical protein
MTIKAYLLSFPERFARAALGLGTGVARQVGEVALPEGIRSSLDLAGLRKEWRDRIRATRQVGL